MDSKSRLLACLPAFLVLTGCASDLYEGRYSFSEGWRKATVVRVQEGTAVKNPGFWKCLRDVPPAVSASRTYVEVQYHVPARHSRKYLVSAPGNGELRPGDPVYVNLSSCEGAIVQRGTGGGGRS